MQYWYLDHRDLAIRAADGDEGAFRELYDRHAPWAVRTDLWSGPSGERLVTAYLRIPRLDDLPARRDGSRLLVWHLTRGTCANWTADSPIVIKDALGVPTSGEAAFTVVIPPSVSPSAELSLQLLADEPNSIGHRIGCAEVRP